MDKPRVSLLDATQTYEWEKDEAADATRRC